MSHDLRSLRLALLSGAVALIAGPVLAQTPPAGQPAKPPAAPAGKPAAAAPATIKDPVVAIVNGQQIRLSELEIAQQSLPQQYRSMPLQAVFPALLERIIDSKLVVQEGKKTKTNEDPAFKKRMAFVEEQVLQDFWIQREISRLVTLEKIQQKYQERLKSMPPEEEVHARHILVATEDEAKAIIAELKKGTPFDKIAKEKSTDKASGAEGGDLGWFKKSDMVKEFADAAFALKKDQTSETPTKTQFGYHVIKIDDRRTAPPPALEELSDQIREELAREAVTAQLDKIRAGSKIEKFNIDGTKVEAAPAAPAAPAATPAKPAAPAQPPK
ncbi:peptidylprolyl isomerase [Reyranella sp.]|uniref:peptidylprolyl isomerase n=1 Tax=Reyranella sp. TaxID=1929291 RepID=UPI002603372F|nr:peptidylprolyl isomerase [Reyranella sp.]HQS18998.1 peptidylprolyl isomerase [Reyranella sp.]HQT15266.1 peptidylprolyl isomerase [Reyranella sp.]